MNLKKIVESLFEDSKRTPIRGLSAIAEAEKYLQQAYEGRYFFELIQNVRDANKEKNQDGEICIELNENILSISNTGAEFSDKGIEGITTIGQSTKQSQDYIGFKGIGFKSIQEVTEEPKIITRYGSIYFDKKLTIKQYNGAALKEDQVPLFYFPHFIDKQLSPIEIEKGIVTKIELPVKANITEDKILEAFSEIKAKQLILLGNIKTLHFKTANHIAQFIIKKNPQKRFIEVKEDDNTSIKFRYFTPSNRLTIPENLIKLLEGKEKELFHKGSHVDINIVLELADNGQIKPIDNAKLYLFYPLQISSGFRFIIHSYFIVNPERTALRASPLNNFLLASIGEFIGREMLKHLKEVKANTNKILCFKRNNDAKINVLYDCLASELKKQRFVYDSKTQKYYSADEVTIADNFDKGLFPDGKLGGKQLIYTDDKEVIQWLQDEFNISYLSYEDIENQIENECKRQAKERKLGFFQKLYNYVSQHEQLNLTNRKVLLTDDWKLVSSDEDVLYGGGRKTPVNLPASIRKRIYFIHKGIKISDIREGKSRTGIIEFSTYELVKRLLKLLDKNFVPNVDLLNTIYNLPLDIKSELEIKEKILLPIKGNNKWLSPLTNPIYFETENLKELYPNGNFINEDLLQWTGDKTNEISPKDFLKKFGVWEIPAVYLKEKNITKYFERRENLLISFTGKSSRPFNIENDRVLHTPIKYNSWFTDSILNNWNTYRSFLQSDLLPKIKCKSSQSWYSTTADALKHSHFTETLSSEKWIVFSGENISYSINDVIGIKHLDFSQPHNQVIGRYLKLLPISYELKQDLIETIGLIHLDGNSIHHFIKLLNRIYKKYEKEIPPEKSFIDFYNRILSKLVDFFYDNNQTENITYLQNEFFLAANELSKKALWAKANQIFYIDDTPNYDLLPISIKEKVQPHFTKKDKNTFGKIAAKIGKRFSNSIKKELIISEAVKVSPLHSYFKFLPELIAILENRLKTVLNDYFEILKDIHVYENERLEVKISIGNLNEIIIPVNYFVDVDNGFEFHFCKASVSNRNKQLSESISELFINLLDRDLKQYNSDLLRFLNSSDKNEFLIDYNILEERVNEIRDELNASDLTPNQKFWEAILLAKQIGSRESLFVSNKINIPYLCNLLNIEEKLSEQIQSTFNFYQTSEPENINLLVELLKVLSLNLEELNKYIFPKIDFRDYYLKRLIKLKNKFENGFEAILHAYLLTQLNSEKSKYQDYIDEFKRNFQFSIPLNTLKLNVKEFFLEALAYKFPFLKISKQEMEEDFSSFNSVAIYSDNLNILKSKLNAVKFTYKELDNFLIENRRRSLLYFKETDTLIEDFKKWLDDFKRKNNPIIEEEDLKNFLNEFSNQTNTSIEKISTKEIESLPSNTNGLAAGNGKRFDGEANDIFKKRLGLVAEMVVYEKLKTIYDKVTWVSKSASKVYKSYQGYNPEGQDDLGYDIEYIDSDGNKYFVEVKGRSDSYDTFEISKNEIDKAYQTKQFYKIMFVTQTFNNSQRRIRDLGNLFLFDDGQDFFANRKFKALYRNFEIRFREQ